jgi:hypothetical protein
MPLLKVRLALRRDLTASRTRMLTAVDVQVPVVLEALIEDTKRRHLIEPRSRQGVREALIE